MDLYRGSKRALYRAKETKPTLLNNNVVLWLYRAEETKTTLLNNNVVLGH
jgi:hypothetical protein